MAFPDLKSAEHLAVNPMGTSPTFRDTDLDITIWESGAVLDYILERYDTQNRFQPPPMNEDPTPENIQIRAKYLQIKQYIIATVYPFIASMYIHSLKPKADIDEKYMESAKHKCHSVLGPVLTRWLGNGPYFLGEGISALDFLVAKPLSNVNAMGQLGDFPALVTLLERIESRPTHVLAYESLTINDTTACEISSKSVPNNRSMMVVPNATMQMQANDVSVEIIMPH